MLLRLEVFCPVNPSPVDMARPTEAGQAPWLPPFLHDILKNWESKMAVTVGRKPAKVAAKKKAQVFVIDCSK